MTSRLILGLAFVLLVGTLGYAILESWSWFDALYMTVITITSIGFAEVHHLSNAGRVFTIFVIVIGFGVVAYSAVTGTRLLIEGEVGKLLLRRYSMKALARMKDHYIVCGFGRMGSFVCKEFHARGIPFVVVESDPEAQDRVLQAGYFLSPGDATEEAVLMTANIQSAKGLVSVLDSDAANVYTVLTSLELNPTIEITARAAQDAAKKKLIRAGATRVISPYQIGGMRIVVSILKPTVMSFLELAMDHLHMNLELEEINVAERSVYSGQRLVDTGIRRDLNLIIIGVKKKDGQMVFNPGPDTVIESHDTLITMGEKKNLEILHKMAGTSS